MRRLLLAAVSVMCAVSAKATKFEVSTDHADCRYDVNKKATFTVTVTDDEGKALNEGEVTWSLDNFGTKTIDAGGKVALAAANPFKVSGALAEPGFLRLNLATADGKAKRVWSVAVAPEKIQASAPRPRDFDKFWTDAKRKLEKEVPLDARMELDPAKSTGKMNYYRVSFATWGGARVYGFYTEPKDASKRYPALVVVPGAGPYHQGSWFGGDRHVSLMLNVLPFSPFTDKETFQKNYSEWNSGTMKKWGVKGQYGAAGIASSREDFVFYPILLGMSRAVDWLAARPTVDKKRIGYFGGSQGGAFGYMLLGVNKNFTRGAMYVPAMCDHLGADLGRATGWPNLIASQSEDRRERAKKFAPYFDAANFAAAIKVPVRSVVGLSDTTCPPYGGWSAFNALKSADKRMESIPGMTHSVKGSIAGSLQWWALGTDPAK